MKDRILVAASALKRLLSENGIKIISQRKYPPVQGYIFTVENKDVDKIVDKVGSLCSYRIEKGKDNTQILLFNQLSYN